MSESWYKEKCEKCETINWVCNGNEMDLSQVDVEAVKCWKCGHICFLGDDEDEIMMEVLGYESAEDANWELGLETPD